MSVKERIKIYVKSINLTISAFEESINVTNGYVNAISKSVGMDKIEIILEKYPNLNLEWLLAGKGEMLKELNGEVKYSLEEYMNIEENLNSKTKISESDNQRENTINELLKASLKDKEKIIESLERENNLLRDLQRMKHSTLKEPIWPIQAEFSKF